MANFLKKQNAEPIEEQSDDEVEDEEQKEDQNQETSVIETREAEVETLLEKVEQLSRRNKTLTCVVHR